MGVNVESRGTDSELGAGHTSWGQFFAIQSRAYGRRVSQAAKTRVTATIIHLKDHCLVAYTLYRGGKLGIVLCSSCLTFRVVNGGYRALRMYSILNPMVSLFHYRGTETEPYQIGTLIVARE